MDCLSDKNKRYRKQLTKLGRNSFGIRPRAAMSDVSLQTLNLARYLATPRVIRGVRVMPQAQVLVIA